MPTKYGMGLGGSLREMGEGGQVVKKGGGGGLGQC